MKYIALDGHHKIQIKYFTTFMTNITTGNIASSINLKNYYITLQKSIKS